MKTAVVFCVLAAALAIANAQRGFTDAFVRFGGIGTGFLDLGGDRSPTGVTSNLFATSAGSGNVDLLSSTFAALPTANGRDFQAATGARGEGTNTANVTTREITSVSPLGTGIQGSANLQSRLTSQSGGQLGGFTSLSTLPTANDNQQLFERLVGNLISG